MPEGLTELMADISREVLRATPSQDCLYKFIADYLDALLETREKGIAVQEIIEESLKRANEAINDFRAHGIPVEKAESAVDIMKDSFKNFVEKKRIRLGKMRELQESELLDAVFRNCEFSNDEVLKCRPIIVRAYKKFMNNYLAAVKGQTTKYMLKSPLLHGTISQRLSLIPDEQELNWAAQKIQSAYRGFAVRKNVSSKEDIPEKLVAKTIDELEKNAREDSALLEEMECAVVKIQAAYRGFQVRRSMPKAGSTTLPDEAILKKADDAATVIQAAYRGFQVRKSSRMHSLLESSPVEVKIENGAEKMEDFKPTVEMDDYKYMKEVVVKGSIDVSPETTITDIKMDEENTVPAKEEEEIKVETPSKVAETDENADETLSVVSKPGNAVPVKKEVAISPKEETTEIKEEANEIKEETPPEVAETDKNADETLDVESKPGNAAPMDVGVKEGNEETKEELPDAPEA